MTTWCRPESSVSPDPATRRSAIARGTGAANGTYLDREGRFARLAYINQQHPARHSIADILGWVEASEEMMASDFGDVDVVCSDEPLDLSLDKSKGSRKEREFERQDIKRAKYHRHHHHHHQDAAVSDAGTDETDAETGVSWNGAGVVQPHLQMAANFSTVLQYYLTAARLWQTSEAMRCQESQDGEAANDGDVPGDPTAAVVAAMAAAAAAANAAAATSATDLVPPAPAAPKKRKKEDVPALVPASSQQVEPASHSGPTRPRKTRTTFTGKQLFELERIFEQKKYLSSNERQEVARLLNVTGSQVSPKQTKRASYVTSRETGLTRLLRGRDFFGRSRRS